MSNGMTTQQKMAAANQSFSPGLYVGYFRMFNSSVAMCYASVCFQRLPFRMRHIVDWLTENIEANFVLLSSDDLMKKTSASENLDCPFFSPKACLSLSRMSLLLSALSPLKRCSGFMHNGTSHRWQTTSLSASCPQNILNASRWANTFFPSFQIRPYPRRDAPENIKQPLVSFCVFSIKRILISGPMGLAILRPSKSYAAYCNVNYGGMQGA